MKINQAKIPLTTVKVANFHISLNMKNRLLMAVTLQQTNLTKD